MCPLDESRTDIDVLIADDDCVTRSALRQILEGGGYRCAEASDGRQAMDLAEQRFPRLVLLDLMMPEMDGYTVAERLRSNPHTRAVHLHCLTGVDFPAAQRAAVRSGFEAFHTKPFDPENLLAVVGNTLKVGTDHPTGAAG